MVTAIPLLCFGAAAIRVPLVVLGLLQYLAPVIQFALGVLLFHEDMPPGRWIGFGLVWVALVDLHRRGDQPPAPAAAAGDRGLRLLAERAPSGSADGRSERAARLRNEVATGVPKPGRAAQAERLATMSAKDSSAVADRAGLEDA